MAAALTSIRQGLADRLAALDGFQISPYVLSNATPPVIWIRPDPGTLVDYHEASRNGLELWHMVVEAYVGTPDSKGAQMKLDDLIESGSTTSVANLLEADQTLGGIAQAVMVEDAHGYAEYARTDGPTVLGCRWNVVIYMNGG